MHRFAALAAGCAGIAVVVFLAMLAIRGSAQLDTVTIGGFASQSLAVALLGIVFGALAMALGAAFGRRSLVLAVCAGLGVLAYAANTFAVQLGAGWVRGLSPFRYYIGGEPLKNGVQWADAGVLAGAAVILVAAAVASFSRRDLAT